MSLYQKCVDAGVTVQSHHSDLDIPVTKETIEFIAEHVKAGGVSPEQFTNNIDRKEWFRVPFAYLPFWEKRGS